MFRTWNRKLRSLCQSGQLTGSVLKEFVDHKIPRK